MEKEKVTDIRKISYRISQIDSDISYLEDLINENTENFKIEAWHDHWFVFTKDDFKAMIEVRNKKIDELMEKLKEILTEDNTYEE